MTEQVSAPSERSKRLAARKARIRALKPRVPTVRVVPTNDAFRAVLKHPSSGMRFPETGSAEWPLDTFTKRRLKDGCITVEGGGSGSPDAPDQTLPAAAQRARRERERTPE